MNDPHEATRQVLWNIHHAWLMYVLLVPTTLVAAYGTSVPIALNCAVTLIDHSGKRLRIETSQGTLIADKVIVTVPTNLIADEAIRFHPALPAKRDAARGLPLGLADKVTLALGEPDALPKEGNWRHPGEPVRQGGLLSYLRSARRSEAGSLSAAATTW